jgi:hypothetical protein
MQAERRGGEFMANQTLCTRLAKIVGGTGMIVNGVCVVQRLRKNLHLTILGRRSKSPLTIPFLLSFESRDSQGRTLNLGETVILEREINPFVTELRKHGIIVTAIHNHWLFQGTCFKYIHWEKVGDPVTFANNTTQAAKKVGIL